MYAIGSEKQLFIDHRFIESSQNITLTVNPPVKREGAVLTSDKPWDAFTIGWYSIVEDEGVYKMWYHACDGDAWAGGRWRLCYCVSDDGFHWEKPNLGIVEYQGSAQNNIVLEDSKLAYVFIDPHGKFEHRYKMVELAVEPGDVKKGMRVATSADGFNWNRPSQNISKLPPRWDTQKQAWWDQQRNKYVVYLRVMLGRDNEPRFPFVEPIESNPPVVAPKTMRPARAVGRVEMDDILAPWPDENVRMVLAADEDDPPNSDIYTHGLYRYPYAADAYFMFPMVYQHYREVESTVSNDGLNDTQFCASRDGIHWMRYDRKSYLPRGLPGELDCGATHGSEYHIRKGDTLYHYYSAGPWTHGGYRRLSDQDRQDRANWGKPFYGVARQRLDGFVSADAPYNGGWLVTCPITFSGNHLELNIDVAAMGQAAVEIQDERGQPVPGFTQDACDRVLFNDIAYTVKWKGDSDLSSLAGRPVRLKIAMRSAKLYAFQFLTS